ncbi:MAG TPA: L,D-transpeptidase, partial [Polyangiaceae bacterium]|nr:L,D-transpeptidase [Polyangiaceae bacterium]
PTTTPTLDDIFVFVFVLPSLYAIRQVVWVLDQPHRAARKLGTLAVGKAVALREPQAGPPAQGCPQGYYAIEPRGFVCNNFQVTVDASHPTVRAYLEYAQPAEGAFPYRYGLSLGAPMYNKLPDEPTHRIVMMRYPPARKLGDWASAFEDLVDPHPASDIKPVPDFFLDGKASPNATHGFVRRKLPHGSMLAFTRAFEYQGRRYLLADDLSAVPADRVLIYKPTSFRGVTITRELLPHFGWTCASPTARFALQDGKMVATGQSFAARHLVRLTPQTERIRGREYRKLRDDSHWVLAHQVCEVNLVDNRPEGIADDEPWIYVSTLERTLVAYEGLRPVFATLHASGRGGVHRGKGDVRNYTTPLGSFPINWKERYATFSPDPGAPTTFWISQVMFVQYFEQPYALHGAYWHERFGIPTSAGCPNLSPYDAERLFTFTQPTLPDGWQAIAPHRNERGTLVVVGR